MTEPGPGRAPRIYTRCPAANPRLSFHWAVEKRMPARLLTNSPALTGSYNPPPPRSFLPPSIACVRRARVDADTLIVDASLAYGLIALRPLRSSTNWSANCMQCMNNFHVFFLVFFGPIPITKVHLASHLRLGEYVIWFTPRYNFNLSSTHPFDVR